MLSYNRFVALIPTARMPLCIYLHTRRGEDTGIELTQGLTGTLIGDRGYISWQLFHVLWERGLHLTTKIRRNRHNPLMPLVDQLLLRKRALIESINDHIKNIQQIAHTRHRRVVNAMVNVVAALVAYTYQPRKPSLNLSQNNISLLTLNE